MIYIINIAKYRMEYISENDYKEIKSFTMKELKRYLKHCEDNRECHIQHIETLNGKEKDRALEIVKEYDVWIKVYKEEIYTRLIINTPPYKPFSL